MRCHERSILSAWVGVVATTAASAVTISIDDRMQPGGGQLLGENYADLGVHFSPNEYGVLAGNSNGDPGNWDLEGTNGPYMQGLRNTPTMVLTFDAPIVDFAVDISRSAGSSGGVVLTLQGFLGGSLVETRTFTLGAINAWTTATFVNNVPMNRVEYSTSRDSYGADNIRFELAAPPTQACCFAGGTCQDLDPGVCAGQGGTAQGERTACAELADVDGDGSPDACDLCDADPDKLTPGVCGCGLADEDCNFNAAADCRDVSEGTSVDCNSDRVPDECQTGQWNGPDGGAFNDAGNWTPVGVPRTNAVLANAAAVNNRCVLGGGGEATLCELTIGATGSGRQTLEIGSGNTLVVLNRTTLSAGGEIALRGGGLAGGLVTNFGNTISGYGEISAAVANYGVMTGSPFRLLELTGDRLENHDDGSVRIAAGMQVLVRTPVVEQAGDVEIRTLGGMVLSQPLVNLPGGRITLLDGALSAPAIINQPGAMIDGAGTLDGPVTNEGEMLIIADTLIAGDLVNNGTITIQSGLFTIGGDLSGTGAIIGGFGARGE